MQKYDENNNPIIRRFVDQTKREFKFLETNYGYCFLASGIENPDYFADAVAYVGYIGPAIGIKVFWYFASAVIDVAFIELQDNKFPEKLYFWGELPGAARAINLRTLVRFLRSDDDESFLLKNLDSIKMSAMKKRAKIISENMEDVVKNLAQVVKTDALNVVLGDTSNFPAIQRLEQEIRESIYRHGDYKHGD